jgi:hypothetical protein
MARAPLAVPTIVETRPDPVRASVGEDVPFLIVGTLLLNVNSLCASHGGNEVVGVYIVVDHNSDNTSNRLNSIVTAKNNMPPDKRDVELKICIKDAGGNIVSSGGVLIVS